jgi:enoyl-CoA hydratase/carnithine racemase
MNDRVTISIRDAVADVRLNRPEKLNALDSPMFDALVQTGEKIASDRSIRAVVLSGQGRGFCAGLDFMSFMAMANQGGKTLLHRDEKSPANHAQRAAFVWQEVPVPVIAAIHGHAFGGGLQIALGADLRYVSADAQLSVKEIKWGLIPDMTGTQSLRRLVRLDVAKELTFTGRVVSGTEAVELGLATRVASPPLQAAFDAATAIAKRSPHAIRHGKRLLNAAGLVGVEEGLRLEEELQVSLIGSPNQIEAVQANLQKRDPEFTDV